VVGSGDKKKSDSQVGYTQATREAEDGQAANPPNPQGIEPLPESQTATSDNASAQNVQEKILEEITS
jgi:hypothetical protein